MNKKIGYKQRLSINIFWDFPKKSRMMIGKKTKIFDYLAEEIQREIGHFVDAKGFSVKSKVTKRAQNERSKK